MNLKHAMPDHPIHELLARRWSPYAFDSHPVPRAELRSLFEAARWAPSCFNEQPWSYCSFNRFVVPGVGAVAWSSFGPNTGRTTNRLKLHYVVAVRDNPDEFERLLSCLVEGNRAWAKDAPVLALGCARLHLTHNGKPNVAAAHDLGLAAGNLCLEATARGLSVHQMIGILPDRARSAYRIPDGVRPFTALAIGYAAAGASPPRLRDRDLAPRTRKPLAEFVFAGTWGTSSTLVE